MKTLRKVRLYRGVPRAGMGSPARVMRRNQIVTAHEVANCRGS